MRFSRQASTFRSAKVDYRINLKSELWTIKNLVKKVFLSVWFHYDAFLWFPELIYREKSSISSKQVKSCFVYSPFWELNFYRSSWGRTNSATLLLLQFFRIQNIFQRVRLSCGHFTSSSLLSTYTRWTRRSHSDKKQHYAASQIIKGFLFTLIKYLKWDSRQRNEKHVNEVKLG